MALILPDEHDKEALAADRKWRIMFGLPLVMYTLMLLGFMTIVRYDSPKYYMSADRQQSAIRSIHTIYNTQSSDRIARTIFHHLENENTGDTSDVTLKQALWTDEAHRRGSWVSIAIIIFSELTGFQAITLFSTSIFGEVLGEDTLNPRIATIILCSVNFVASFVSILTVRMFGRRTLLIWGQAGSAVCLLLIGFFTILGFNTGVLGMIFLFVFIYQNTVEPCGQIYVTEVCCDIAMGFAGQVLWLVILLETLTTEPLMKSPIGSQGVFFIFGAFCVLGTFFNYFFVAETKGLSEKEKKSLYLPGAKFGRELKITEKG